MNHEKPLLQIWNEMHHLNKVSKSECKDKMWIHQNYEFIYRTECFTIAYNISESQKFDWVLRCY